VIKLLRFFVFIGFMASAEREPITDVWTYNGGLGAELPAGVQEAEPPVRG